jgi:hypothetical protein
MDQGGISISNNFLSCGSQSLQIGINGRVMITGSTTTNSISITDSNIILQLSSVIIESSSPFLSLHSNTTFIQSGSSRFVASGSSASGIGCTELSSLIFLALSGDSLLTALGGLSGCGIGPGLNRLCTSIHFLNGTYIARAGYEGGTGIGSGRGALNGTSSVGSVSIQNGNFTATGYYSSGIGSAIGESNSNSSVGHISIQNGTFHAVGVYGAGIGAGSGYSGGKSSVGSISIQNGNFTASGNSGAGIGSGYAYVNGNSHVGSISIQNGIFSPTQSAHSGIGSGRGESNSNSSVGNISIQNGDFTGRGLSGAGIGSGEGSWNGNSNVGNIWIQNGTFIATGSYGAGIGSGRGYSNGNSSVGNIWIQNGTFTATGSSGAGIGSGAGSTNGNSSVESISIIDGRINATGSDAAGIGGGFVEASGLSTVGDLLISGGSITASGSGGAAGIGGGYSLSYSVPPVSVKTIVINGGCFNVTSSGSGAAIGSGGWNGSTTSPFYSVSNLSISGGTFHLWSRSGAGVGASTFSSPGVITDLSLVGGSFFVHEGIVGIGGSNLSSVAHLRLGSAYIDCRSIGANICLRVSSLLFDNGSLTSVTGASNLLEFDRITFSFSSEIYTIYTGFSKQEGFTGLPIIHIESVLFPSNLTSEITVIGAVDVNERFNRSVLFNSESERGFGISVPSVGNYTITYGSTDGSSHGCLVHDGFTTFAALRKIDTFYGNAQGVAECPLAPTYTFTSNEVGCPGHPRHFIRFSFFMLIAGV